MADDAETVDALLCSDFKSFLRMVFLTLNPDREYMSNWHIDAIVHCLEEIYRGNITQQIITMPPRYLKTTIVSVAFVAWVLGQVPTKRIICASYADDLAKKFSRDTRKIMESPWYKKVFPKTRLDKITETELTTTMGGFRLATSVDGIATGRGGDLIIIDDPIKTGEASSDLELEKVNKWNDQTMSTRLDDKKLGAILVIMQRVHENDLAGHLLEKDGWKSLKLPAIATEREKIQIGPNKFHIRKRGDVLHHEREDLELLDRIKANMGSFAFAAQYQQDPVPAEGNMIQLEWIKWYDKQLKPSDFKMVIQSWDVALKTGPTNDYSVCTTWGVRQDGVYLLHVYRHRLALPALIKRVHQLAAQFEAIGVLIEDIGPGTSLIQSLGRVAQFNVIPIRPKGDKICRVVQASVMIHAGRVFIPKDAPWTADFLTEILAFPNGKFDDQVDSMTQFLIWQRDGERRRPSEVNLYIFGAGSRRKRLSNYFERNGVLPPF